MLTISTCAHHIHVLTISTCSPYPRAHHIPCINLSIMHMLTKKTCINDYAKRVIVITCILELNCKPTILLTKTTAARNGVALSYHSVRGLHFLAVVFVRSIYSLVLCFRNDNNTCWRTLSLCK